MDRRARLVNHLRPDQGMAGIPSFTKRRLLVLPLDTETMFAGQFDEVLKETTGTQAVAVQAAQIARGSPPVGLSSFKIPKRPATQSKGQGLPKKKAKKGKSPPQQQQQRDPQPPQQSSGPAREPTQRNFPPSSFSGSRGRGRGRGGAPGPNDAGPGPVGGRLREFAGAWEELTSDKWVLQTIISGYRIEFTGSVRLTKAPMWTQIPKKLSQRLALEEGLGKMLRKKAILRLNPSSLGPGLFSSLFLVEKRSGGWRPILNLRRLNEAVIPLKFKMDTLQSVMNTLGGDIKLARDAFSAGAEASGPWAVSLDLQDAYFHVAINPRDTKQFSPLRLRRGNFRISGPTFRALDRPQDVHSPGKGNRCLPEDVWYKHLPVPR